MYDPTVFDAPLSDRGVAQAKTLGAQVKISGSNRQEDDEEADEGSAAALAGNVYLADLQRVSVVVVSPLTRAIQTAALVFEHLPVPPKLVLLPVRELNPFCCAIIFLPFFLPSHILQAYIHHCCGTTRTIQAVREQVYSSCDVGQYGNDLINNPALSHAKKVFPQLESELIGKFRTDCCCRCARGGLRAFPHKHTFRMSYFIKKNTPFVCALLIVYGSTSVNCHSTCRLCHSYADVCIVL